MNERGLTVDRRVFRVTTTVKRLSCQHRVGPYYAYGRQKLLPRFPAERLSQENVITRRLPVMAALKLCCARKTHGRPDGVVLDDGPLVLPEDPSGRDRHMGNYDWIEGSEVGTLLRDLRLASRDVSTSSWYPSMALYCNRRLFLMYDHDQGTDEEDDERFWNLAYFPRPLRF